MLPVTGCFCFGRISNGQTQVRRPAPVGEMKLTEGKATGFPLIKDEMAKNGSPDPVFYTDDERILFLVTLPCHPKWKESKPEPKSLSKITIPEVDDIFLKGIDIQSLSELLNQDLSDVSDYVRTRLETKPGTKSGSKSGAKWLDIIDQLADVPKSRADLLEGIKMYNRTSNFNNYIKPLMDAGIIEMTIPE